MKNSLKLVVSLLVGGLMLLNGCGTPSTSLPSELVGHKSGSPETINILAPEFFRYSLAENSDQIKQQWLDEMSQRYGVKLNIVSNYYKDSKNNDYSASSQIAEMMLGKTTFAGLISIYSISDLNMYLRNNTLLPLEDYLADNPVWNALPDDFKSLFEIDGHIYAIPTSVSRVQNARVIHDEALQKTGITVTDLDSFRKFALAYTQETGNAAFDYYGDYSVEDILNAFGLYPNDIPFNYDPKEDCYVDWLTKGSAVDALEYLRKLYQAGAMYYGYDAEMRSKFNSGTLASVYDQYYDYENCSELFTLNPEYPQIAHTTTSGFVMTKDTPQPKETINFFVNMLFGSEKNYLDCWLGTSDNYILNSDGTITMEMTQDAKGNYVTPCTPNLTGGLSELFPHSAADLYLSQNGVVTMDSKADAGKYNANLKLQSDAIKKGSLVEIPPLYQMIKSPSYDASKNSVDKWYLECIDNAITNPNMTVQQAVDDYRATMLNIGGNAMLDEMNAAIGKKTAYYYG